MTSRGMAWLTVVSALTLTLVGLGGWNSWRRHQLEEIPIGADKAEVLRRLGQPDNLPTALAMGCASTAEECWTWKLIGQSYLQVCFDQSGKVVCREAYAIWT